MFCFALFEGRNSSFTILRCGFVYAPLGQEIQKDTITSISIWIQELKQGPSVEFESNKLDCIFP